MSPVLLVVYLIACVTAIVVASGVAADRHYADAERYYADERRKRELRNRG